MMVKDLERLWIMCASISSIGSVPCSRYARNGAVQSSSGAATATRDYSGSSGTPRSTSFGGRIDGLLMTSRKTPGGRLLGGSDPGEFISVFVLAPVDPLDREA